MKKILFALITLIAAAVYAETDYPSADSLERLWTRYDRMDLRLENVEGGVTAVAGVTNGVLASNLVFIGSSANIAAPQAITGDIGITTGGVVSISSGVIVNADIATNAAIAKTKLASLAIANADVATNAAIDSTKIASIAVTSTNTGAVAVIPTLTTPSFVGQILVNTASNFVYVSKGATTNDWLLIN